MEGKIGVTRSIIDELHSSDMMKWNVKVVLLAVSLMKLILRISNEIQRRVIVVFLEVPLMTFIL